MQAENQPQFMPLDEHARRLNRSLFTVRNQAAAGVWPVPTIKMGRRRMVPVAAHEEYVRSLLAQIETQQPAPEAQAPAPARPQQAQAQASANAKPKQPRRGRPRDAERGQS